MLAEPANSIETNTMERFFIIIVYYAKEAAKIKYTHTK